MLKTLKAKMVNFISSKTGQLNSLTGSAIGLVILAIVLGVGGTILTNIRDTQTADTSAFNATVLGNRGIQTFNTWLPILAIVLVSVAVIALVINSFRTQ